MTVAEGLRIVLVLLYLLLPLVTSNSSPLCLPSFCNPMAPQRVFCAFCNKETSRSHERKHHHDQANPYSTTNTAASAPAMSSLDYVLTFNDKPTGPSLHSSQSFMDVDVPNLLPSGFDDAPRTGIDAILESIFGNCPQIFLDPESEDEEDTKDEGEPMEEEKSELEDPFLFNWEQYAAEFRSETALDHVQAELESEIVGISKNIHSAILVLAHHLV